MKWGFLLVLLLEISNASWFGVWWEPKLVTLTPPDLSLVRAHPLSMPAPHLPLPLSALVLLWDQSFNGFIYVYCYTWVAQTDVLQMFHSPAVHFNTSNSIFVCDWSLVPQNWFRTLKVAAGYSRLFLSKLVDCLDFCSNLIWHAYILFYFERYITLQCHEVMMMDCMIYVQIISLKNLEKEFRVDFLELSVDIIYFSRWVNLFIQLFFFLSEA